MYVCVCVYAGMHACVCVCVFLWGHGPIHNGYSSTGLIDVTITSVKTSMFLPQGNTQRQTNAMYKDLYFE